MAKAAQRSLLVLDGAGISPLEQVKERPGCYGTWETLCTGVCGVLDSCRESSPKEQVKRLRVVADQGFAREMQLLVPANKDYVFCNTPKLVDWAYDQIEKATDVAFDIETTHPTAGGDDRIEEDFRNVPIGWSWSWADHVAAYMPLYTNDEREMFWTDKEVFDHIVQRGKKVLENPNIAVHAQNCLTGDTRVWMADGRKLALSYLVAHKHAGPVLTLNEKTGKIEPHKIVGWIRAGLRPWKDWLKIRVRGKGELRLTRDHQVITARGRLRAEEITVGDRIYTDRTQLTEPQQQLIYGSLLGDASLIKDEKGKARSPYFLVGHSIEDQESYLDIKSNILGKLVKKVYLQRNNKGFSNGTPFKVVRTESDPRLEEFRDKCFKYRVVKWRGKLTRRLVKTIDYAWLNELTDAALAIWYCDDGSLDLTSAKICVTKLGVKGAKLLTRFLKKSRGWPAKLKYKYDPEYGRQIYVVISGPANKGPIGLDSSVISFWKAIGPYVPTCMSNKLPERFRHLASDAFWLDEKDTGTAWADEVVDVGPLLKKSGDKRRHGGYTAQGRKGLYQYCLTVEGNHNFLAEGLSVSNCKFDLKHVRRTFGINVNSLMCDTMLQHHLLDENRAFSSHGLDDMASKFLHPVFAKYYEVLKRALDFYDPKLRRYSKVPPEVIWPYACSDADATRLLALLFERMLKSEGKLLDLYNSIVRPLSQVIVEMEMTGLDIDNERVQANIVNLGQQISKLEMEAKQLAGVEFDLGSPEQLAHVLFDVLKLKGGKRGKTGFSTDKEVLAKLQDQHPVVRLAQEHRKLIKLRGTYVEGLHRRLIEGRYYPPWNQNGTISGRFSTELVNLLPREEHGGGMIKGQFKAPEGYVLLFRDLSQIELRMGAHVSQDAFMLDGYRNGGRDFDLHAKTAAGVFKNKVIAPAGWANPHDFSWVKTYFKKYRSISKNINFLTAYGGGPDRLMELVNSDYPEEAITKEEAESFIDDYFKVMTGLARAIKDCHIFLQKHGYVESLFGRRRRLPDGQIVTWDRNVPYSRPDCYGRDSPRLHSQLGVPSEEIPGMVNNFPSQNALVTVRAYNDRMRNKTTGVGPFDKCVKGPHDPNWFCSFLPICLIEKERRSRTHIIGEAQRQAFNFLLQSAAGDYTNLALVKIWAEIKKNNLQSRPVLQIHDALGFLVPYHEVDYMLWLTRDRMENAYPLSLPITSEAGVAKYWGEEDNKIPKECKACKNKLQVGEIGIEQLGEWSRFTQYESRCDKCSRVEQIRVFATGDHLS